MKLLKYILVSFIVFSFYLNLYCNKEPTLIPQKIIFYSSKNQYVNPIGKQLIDETISVLEEFDGKSDVVYIKENEWTKYKGLISDLKNKENLSRFFVATGISSIIFISVDDRLDRVIVYLYIFDILKDELYNDSIAMLKSNFVNELPDYIDFIKKNISSRVSKIDLNELRKNKLERRIKNRKNPKYELYLSGGIGYYSRQSLGGDTYSLGFTPFFNIDGRTFNFGYNLHGEFSPLFNTPPLQGRYFLFNTFSDLNIGGWIAKKTFRLGAGLGVSSGTYFYEKEYFEDDHNDSVEVDTLNITLLFPYLRISFLPIRSILIDIDFGSYICLSHLYRVRPLNYFPFYIRLGLKCIIYKQLFLDISVPYYQFRMNFENDREAMGLLGMINIGIGWRFEWGEWR